MNFTFHLKEQHPIKKSAQRITSDNSEKADSDNMSTKTYIHIKANKKGDIRIQDDEEYLPSEMNKAKAKLDLDHGVNFRKHQSERQNKYWFDCGINLNLIVIVLLLLGLAGVCFNLAFKQDLKPKIKKVKNNEKPVKNKANKSKRSK